MCVALGGGFGLEATEGKEEGGSIVCTKACTSVGGRVVDEGVGEMSL
jgi:hypothetical protein